MRRLLLLLAILSLGLGCAEGRRQDAKKLIVQGGHCKEPKIFLKHHYGVTGIVEARCPETTYIVYCQDHGDCRIVHQYRHCK